MFVCPICHNSDIRYIAYKNNEPYCRRCINFIGNKADTSLIRNDNSNYEINYELSSEQKDIALKVKQSYISKKNTLIHAVCGAGKTELIFEVVAYALSRNQQVGFCVPRRDVVIDLVDRFKSAFKNRKITIVYGGHTEKLQGDIILLTTHQLYRYENYFDLLIIDETDAFPYQGNFVLKSFFYRSLKGNYVMMSATPLNSMIEQLKKEGGTYLSLFKRYHGHEMPVPKILIRPFIKLFILIKYMKKFIDLNKPFLIFCPTIDECEKLFKIVGKLFNNGNFVHSKKIDREEVISDFKVRKYDFLLTTTLLERGITIKNLQVIVYDAQCLIYDAKTLIQISGRVGRKIDSYDGEVIFISDYITMAMIQAKKEIESANEELLCSML